MMYEMTAEEDKFLCASMVFGIAGGWVGSIPLFVNQALLDYLIVIGMTLLGGSVGLVSGYSMIACRHGWNARRANPALTPAPASGDMPGTAETSSQEMSVFSS